ncbi:hypothetical protein BDD12DRAFT_841862 [Trichophaea hybrida]|nr:hypothetical protein BDD12DRAFT_841862 [Trichophaea hybrida]
MSFTTYLLTTFCAIAFIEAVSWDEAQTTSLSSSAIWNLNPTPAPVLGGDNALLHSNDLRRRQAHGSLCGYKNGEPDSPVTCGDVSTPVCTTFSSLSAIGCCNEWDGNQCYVYTGCINSYEYVALCGSGSSGCTPKGMTRTCSSSDTPYCHRYTQSGYSVYGCGIFPTVDSLSMTFFSSNLNTQKPTSTNPTTTADTAGVSGTPTTSACPNRICKPIPVGTIARLCCWRSIDSCCGSGGARVHTPTEPAISSPSSSVFWAYSAAVSWSLSKLRLLPPRQWRWRICSVITP